ncbi:hypothetical protein ONZ51_g1758 [Trametes cubensis]|uniref:C2H2-type domain-containing protein n=1 Tax=Trametes cubensis TaxID=1111947 RepID=A0AAD7U1F5_9APHY|nr:hypothetical protein ONZ51_g1758 [Trametes cubensis]
MRPRRKHHSPYAHKCPHCTNPEKWCKNLSGLTQHINSVHIELFRAPSPIPPSPPPLPFAEDEHVEAADGPEAQQPPATGEQLDSEEADQTWTTEHHPTLTGRPCDFLGNDLPPNAAVPHRTTAAPDDWYPYSSRVEFELAEFLFKKDQMAQPNISTLMDLWAADVLRYGGTPPFADHVDLHRTIDATDLGDVSWTVLHISYVGPRPTHDVPPWMNETYELWYRDPRKVALKMLADPTFDGHFDYAAHREFTAKGERRYSNLMSGNWAWKISDAISTDIAESDGAMVVPIVLGSDKTTVSVATGQNDYYPLYMSLGNLHNGMRRAHRDSILPIAFLAIPKAERKYADTTAYRRFRRQLFHTSLAAILQSLKPGMHRPEVAQCPDGRFRRVVWALGPYIADYPEQVLVANIVQGWCPACLKFPDRLDADGPGQKRARIHTEALLRTFEPPVLWDDYGVVASVVPFTSDFPRADINELLSGDLLHQVIKGTFKDHLVTWVGQYLQHVHGEAKAKELLDEIDRRLAATPPFPGLRHFKQGRDFKQWTGDDSKALMKVYLPAISGIVPSAIVRAMSSFLEFCYIARRSYLTESLLARMEQARRDFHHHRVIFQDSGVRPDGFSLPRQHSLDHYLQHIRNFGAPNGLCSSMTEAKHIKAVKEPWRRSNRHEALGQMLLTNQRLEKLSAARADFTARGMMQGTCLSAALIRLEHEAAAARGGNHNNENTGEDKDESDGEDEDESDGEDEDESDSGDGDGDGDEDDLHDVDGSRDADDDDPHSDADDDPHSDVDDDPRLDVDDDSRDALNVDDARDVEARAHLNHNPAQQHYDYTPEASRPGSAERDHMHVHRMTTGLDDDQAIDNEQGNLDSIVNGPRISGFVVLARKPRPHYPRALSDLGHYISIPNLSLLVSRFLYERAHPDNLQVLDDDNLPLYDVKRVHVFHSATATFYAPSDPSGQGGMRREHIRATPSWRKGSPRYDCVFLGKDPSARGFQSLHAARIRSFLSLRVGSSWSASSGSSEFEEIPCAVIEWFSPVGEEPDDDTGMWVVEPDLDIDGQRELSIVHIETILRSAHLIPVFGDEPIPQYLTASDALDSFRAYYVNKYADHHAHTIAF